MISENLIRETIELINDKGLRETLQQLKSKDYQVELLEKIALWPSLSWQDQVVIEYELHLLRQFQYGVNKGGRPGSEGKSGWSQVDTARELGISMAKFSGDLSLAVALQANPHLRNIKSKPVALKFVKRATNREISRAESLIPDKFESEALLGDSNDLLELVSSGTFDVCITDPPWSKYIDPELCSDSKTNLVFPKIYRCLKKDSFLYVFLPSTDYPEYCDLLTQIGFKVQQYPLIWHKKNMMSHGLTTWQYMRNYEFILLAVKGSPSLAAGTDLPSIFEYPIVHASKCIHPHEKPIDLIKKILLQCGYEGMKVLDPFAGSGVVGEACKKLDRKYMIIERDPKRFSLIEKRLEK